MLKPYYLRVRPDRGGLWYVSFYTNGKQTPWKSTRTTDREAAEKWAAEHNPANIPHVLYCHSDREKLKAAAAALADLPNPALVPHIKFGQFARKWFEPNHEWVKRQIGRGRHLSLSYLDGCRGVLRKHILPQWRTWALEDISAGAIDDWLFALKDPPRSRGKQRVALSSSRVNTCLIIMRVMLRYAARKGYIKASPLQPIANGW